MTNMWSDEDGVCYAEGHLDPKEMIKAVGDYLTETGADTDPVVYESSDVRHVWYTQDPNDEERLVERPARFADAAPHTVVAPS